MHKNELICQKCAINCGIEGNASNENITKYKNLSGVKSISNSVHRLARYRIVALISIGRLCRLNRRDQLQIITPISTIALRFIHRLVGKSKSSKDSFLQYKEGLGGI